MIPKKQTRLHNNDQRGNCFAACIASIIEMEVEKVIQIQEYYDNPNWPIILWEWLNDRNYDYSEDNRFNVFHKSELTLQDIKTKLELKDQFYFVTGISPRNSNIHHIVIFKNGKMVHDPHPDNTGIINDFTFSIINKLN